MTPDEAEICQRLLVGHWPQPQLTEEEAAAWYRTLLPLDARMSMGVLDLLAVSSPFRPTDGIFLAEYRKMHRRAQEQEEQATRRAELEEPPVSPERRHQIVAAIRAQLT